MHAACPAGTSALHAPPENGSENRLVHRPRMPFRFGYIRMARNVIFGPDHATRCASAFGASSSANKKREAPFERPVPASSAPASRSADPHKSPPSRVEGKSGNAVPLGNVRPSASLLSAVSRAKLRDCVYRLNPEWRVWWWRRVLHRIFDSDRLESTLSGHCGSRRWPSRLGGSGHSPRVLAGAN
jgi:hypothetical protein